MRGHPTWLTPLWETYRTQYPGAVMQSVCPLIARYCRPLVGVYPVEQVAAEFQAYLAQTNPHFLSLAKFAACFGSWTKSPVPTTPRRHYQTADEADRRAGIPVRGQP